MAKKITSLDEIREYSIVEPYPNLDAFKKVVNLMRIGVLNKEHPTIPRGLIHAATQEIDLVSPTLDESTYVFAEDLFGYAFGKATRPRVFHALKGTLLGNRRNDTIENTVFVKDYERNPWPLHAGRNRARETIDTLVTTQAAEELLAAKKGTLNRFKRFEVAQSPFFYVDWRSLDPLVREWYERGRTAELILPHIMDTGGYLGADACPYPNYGMFDLRFVPFTSYRLKKSLGPTILRELFADRGEFKNIQETNGDWGGHRLVFSDPDQVEYFMKTFINAQADRSKVEMGRFSLSVRYIKDYWTTPKGNDYRAYKMVVKVTHPRHQPHIREIQVTDMASYYNAEINRDHRAHHSIRERERLDKLPDKGIHAEMVVNFREIFEQMFGTPTLAFNVPH